MKMTGAIYFIYYFLQWTWGLLQNIAGLMIWLFLRAAGKGHRRFRFLGSPVTEISGGYGSMGVGMFIFFGHSGAENGREILIHEYGHTWQSAILGPLFIPIVGLPSLIWAAMPLKKRKMKYMDFYTEAWANRLGKRMAEKTPH